MLYKKQIIQMLHDDFFEYIMQKFSCEFLELKHGLKASHACYSRQTTIIQCAIVICISNGCAEVLKRTEKRLFFRTHHHPQTNTEHTFPYPVE